MKIFKSMRRVTRMLTAARGHFYDKEFVEAYNLASVGLAALVELQDDLNQVRANLVKACRGKEVQTLDQLCEKYYADLTTLSKKSDLEIVKEAPYVQEV